MMRPAVRTGFRGLNHNLSAGDGEIYWMENLSSREYPLMASRIGWAFAPNVRVNNGIGSYKGELFWSYRYDFYYGENSQTPKGTVAYSSKQFACMGDYILIFPDKKFYNVRTGVFGPMGAGRSVGSLQFQNGTYAGVPANANTLYKDSSDIWSDFSVGDAVTITGCTTHPENNKTVVIREIDGYYLRFDENVFTLDDTLRYTAGEAGLPAGVYHFEEGQFTLSTDLSEGDTLTWNGTGLDAVIGGASSTITVTAGTGGTAIVFSDIPTNYTEATVVSVRRVIPDLDHVCVNENRLWGCKGDTIYASALGDPFNFNVFEGLSTDSWQSTTQGSGDFTGCVSYGGYPIFFKEDCIIKVQGDSPKNFGWTPSSRFGVKAGCGKSLAVAGETLFYVSPAGVCAYNGGAPRVISEALGKSKEWVNAVGGSDGIRYYVSLNSSSMGSGGDYYYDPFIGIYDTRYGEWFLQNEDNEDILGFAHHNGYMYVVTSCPQELDPEHYIYYSGTAYIMNPKPGDGLTRVPFGNPWYAEFADSTRVYETTDTGSQDKKGLLRLQIRCSLKQDSYFQVRVEYDSDGQQHDLGYIIGEITRTYNEEGELVSWTSAAVKKKTFIVPMILRRCDHYRIRLYGEGECVIYSITEVKYGGSNLQGGSPVPSGEIPI